MNILYDILDKLYQMTAFSAIAENPLFIVMYLLAFTLLYLGIVKKYEPLLLVPIHCQLPWRRYGCSAGQ